MLKQKKIKTLIGAALVSASMFAYSHQALANILVAEIIAGNAELYSTSGTDLDTFVSGLINPLGVLEGGTNIFVSDITTGEIHKYTLTIPPTDEGIVDQQINFQDEPCGLAWSGGRLYAAYYGGGELISYQPDAGIEDGDPNTPSPEIVLPVSVPQAHGVADASPNGLPGVYFTWAGGLGYWDGATNSSEDYTTNLYTIDSSNTVRGCVAFGGYVYIALAGANKVIQYDTIHNTAADWVLDTTPVGLVIQDGILYVSSTDGSTVTSYSLADKSQQSQFGVPTPQYICWTTLSIPLPVLFAARDFSNATMVTVVFGRPVSAATATNVTNYALNNGGTISGASLSLDGTTVVLTTSPLLGSSNVLTINSVQDLGGNSITPNTQVTISIPVAPPLQASFLVVENGAGTAAAELYNQAGTHLGTFASGVPIWIGIASSGSNIYASQFFSGETHKYTFTMPGTDLGAMLSGDTAFEPAGLAWADNRLYVASYGHQELFSWQPDPGEEDGNPNTQSPQIVVGPFASPVDSVTPASPNGLPGVYFATADGPDVILGYWDGVSDSYTNLYDFGPSWALRGVVAYGGYVYVGQNGPGTAPPAQIVQYNTTNGAVTNWVSIPTGATVNGLAIGGPNLYATLYGGGYHGVIGYSLADASELLNFTCRAIPQQVALVSLTVPPPPPPQLQIIGVNTNGVTLQFEAASNYIYTVQSTPTLQPAAWSTLTNFAASPSNALMTVVGAGATNTSRFYRATANYP